MTFPAGRNCPATLPELETPMNPRNRAGLVYPTGSTAPAIMFWRWFPHRHRSYVVASERVLKCSRCGTLLGRHGR